MSPVLHLAGNGWSASEHAVRYEALRCYAIERHGPVVRLGLAVLLRQGVAVWMEAWSKLPAPVAHTTKDDTARLLPCSDSSSTQVVRILAAMALEHIQQVHL